MQTRFDGEHDGAGSGTGRERVRGTPRFGRRQRTSPFHPDDVVVAPVVLMTRGRLWSPMRESRARHNEERMYPNRSAHASAHLPSSQQNQDQHRSGHKPRTSISSLVQPPLAASFNNNHYEEEDEGECRVEANDYEQRHYNPSNHAAVLHRDYRSSSPASTLASQSARRTFSSLRPPLARTATLASTTSAASEAAALESKFPPSAPSTPMSSTSDLVKTEPPAATSQKETGAVATPNSGKKRTRYLRDTDRWHIIQRIENGEKQAALAREFGVTRAAICHIKKNRDEIVTRYDLLVRSAKDLDTAENKAARPSEGQSVTVLEKRSHSVLLLLTTLRNVASSPSDFRRAACRLIMILLEEAIASLGSIPLEVVAPSGHLFQGRGKSGLLCGVAIGAEGYPFLKLFNQMEPDAAKGYIHMEADARQQERPQERPRKREAVWRHQWHVERTDLPPNVIDCEVLLFMSTSSDGECICKAIEVLHRLGVPETSVCVVTILCAADAVATICSQFPQIKIIAAAVDAETDPRTQSIIPGLGDFVARYNA